MITYKITSKHIPLQPATTSPKPSQDHLEKILRKATIKAFKVFPPGCSVRFKGSKREGTVMGIRVKVDDCSWKGQKPFFINVKFHDDQPVNNVLAHSSSLERINAK